MDYAMLFHEFSHYIGEKIVEGEPKLLTEPDFYQRPFREVEREYLTVFERLHKGIFSSIS